jgi:hypothetical protein
MPNRTQDDNKAINNLLQALRGGVENERQCGDLMAFLARAEATYGRIREMQGARIINCLQFVVLYAYLPPGFRLNSALQPIV